MNSAMKGLREKPAGSGQYELAFYDKNKKPKRAYERFRASSYELAVKRAFEFIEAYEKGDYDPWTKRTDNVEEAVKGYLRLAERQRQNTYQAKRSTLVTFLRSTASRSFASMDYETVSRYAARFPNQATRRTRLQMLGHFWRWCIDEGYTKRNPVAEYLRRNRMGSKKTRQRDAMTVQEYLQVYGEALADPTIENPASIYFPPFIELGVCTGLRRGELIALNIRDITSDGRTGSIHIREWTDPRTGEHFVPKHGRERVVPLVPRAAAMVKGLVENLNTDDPWRRIFSNPFTPEERVKENDASRRFMLARRRVGLGRSYTLHSTRHSFLSWLIMCSVDPYAVMDIAGHKDLQTQQRYVHFSRVMLSGGASAVRRGIVSFLCPGVSDEALAFAFPDSSTWYGSAVAGSRLDILDILFGGLLYDEALLAALKQSEMRRRIGRN